MRAKRNAQRAVGEAVLGRGELAPDRKFALGDGDDIATPALGLLRGLAAQCAGQYRYAEPSLGRWRSRSAASAFWPADRRWAFQEFAPPSSPTSAGFVQPHSLMLAAMAAIWASECVRAFLA